MQLEAEASVSKELAASSPASPLLSGSGGSALDDKFKALEGGSSVDDELLAMKRALPVKIGWSFSKHTLANATNKDNVTGDAV